MDDRFVLRRSQEYLPGIVVIIAIALFSVAVANLLPIGNSLFIAILTGAAIANTYGVPSLAEDGIGLHKLFLEIGIVLMGARIVVEEFLAAGPTIFVLAIATVAFGLTFVELISRVALNVTPKTGALLAAGSSICGVSAVIAVAGSIDPDEDQIAYAVGTILLFDAVTLLLFPAIGHLLHLPSQTFGIWAGLSMFSTGPVAAAGFTYSPVAGEWATVTKLVRNSLIGIVAIGYSVGFAHYSDESNGITITEIWDEFPKFLVGFLLVMTIANSGFLSESQIVAIERISDAMFMLAFAGFGFDIKAREIQKTGLRPIVLVLSYLVAVTAITLILVVLLF